MKLAVIAHNIRSMHNVGSIFRACDCFGVEKLYITGYTATPPRREIEKVSLGTEEFVDWEYRDDVVGLVKELKDQGYTIASLEIDERSVPIGDFKTEKPVALILGHEVDGVPPEIRDMSDVILEIPAVGHKTALNISVATGIALHELKNNN